jgi:hypothetical protein
MVGLFLRQQCIDYETMLPLLIVTIETRTFTINLKNEITPSTTHVFPFLDL